MKNLGDLFFSYIKEGYKKEFLIWLLSIIILILSLFILIKELKKFMVLNKSKEEVERSYISLQPQIVQIKKISLKLIGICLLKRQKFRQIIKLV